MYFGLILVYSDFSVTTSIENRKRKLLTGCYFDNCFSFYFMAGGLKSVVVFLFTVPTPAVTSADANATINQLFISFLLDTMLLVVWMAGHSVLLLPCVETFGRFFATKMTFT